jgi:hypothetical protein
MIKYDDFESGLMSDESSVEKVDAAVVAAEAELKLVNNADSYSKQISAYSKGEACRHVALFNWDHLLLYKFNQKGSGGDAGSRAHLSWVNEEGGSGAFMQRCHIRKAMSGWILTAFEDVYGSD